MKPALHKFTEGEMTVADFIQKHAPCLPEKTVRWHMAAGRMSAQAMLTYSPAAAMRAAKLKSKATQSRFRVGARKLGTAGHRFK